ncbi:MAG: heavy metal-responsive transcriptional regulator, partial [Alphaproteobacteria bacterium]
MSVFKNEMVVSGLTIGKLAKACGVRSDTLRYYERLGLIKSEGRKANGYRVFTEDSLLRLQFIQRAKLLNFTLEEIKDLFVVRGSSESNCEQIYERLQGKIAEIDGKIGELTTFKRELQSIA